MIFLNFQWYYTDMLKYIYICLCVCVCVRERERERERVFFSLSTQAWYGTRSIFKRSFIGFEFSFPSSWSVTTLRLKKPLQFTHNWRKISWMHTFPKWINAIWNANSLVQDFELGSPILLLKLHLQIQFRIKPDFLRGWRPS